MAYELSRELLYSTISSSRIYNRRTQYWRNKSFVCCCPWQTLLIHTRTNTTLPLNNSKGHSFSTAQHDMPDTLYPICIPIFTSYLPTVLQNKISLDHIHRVRCLYTCFKQNINGCQLEHEEADHHTIFVDVYLSTLCILKS
jgi:hypothetical protein